MYRRLKVILAFLTASALMSSHDLLAQGISRSSGIGLRVSYWNIANRPTRFNISNDGTRTVYDFSGFGSSLYFFSRLHHSDWFLEFSLGTVANVHGEENDVVGA